VSHPPGTVSGARRDATGVDQGYTGSEAVEAAHGIQLDVGKLPDAQGPKHRFVLLLCRGVGERRFAWMARFRRLALDYERLPRTVAGLTFLTVICLMLHPLISLPFSS
jgi:transposase